MSAVLDQTFLNPHWRTVLWSKQRKKCEACSNLCTTVPGAPDGRCETKADITPGMRCNAVQARNGCPGVRDAPAYCIDAREINAACGPTAKLFKPKETT